MTNMSVPIVDDQAAQRFEAAVDGEVAVLRYRREPGRFVLISTDVPPNLQGHGLGSMLAQAALRTASDRGLLVVPLCPFVASYIRRHPEYLPLVMPEYRAQVTST